MIVFYAKRTLFDVKDIYHNLEHSCLTDLEEYAHFCLLNISIFFHIMQIKT